MAFAYIVGGSTVGILVDFVQKALGVLASIAREGTGEKCG